MSIISIINQKGGTCKTTTAIHVGAYLAREGKTVLLVDLDPQGNLSDLTATPHHEGLLKLIIEDAHPDEVILDIPDSFHGGRGILQLLPGNKRTAAIPLEMQLVGMKIEHLVKKFGQLREIYDYVIFDNPPTVSPLTPASLSATDWILIPTQVNFLSAIGVDEVVTLMANYADQHHAQILGILPTHTRPRTLEYRDRMGELKGYYDDLVWEDVATTHSSMWEEASWAARPVYVYQPTHKAAGQALAIGQRVLDLTKEAANAS